MKTKLTITKLEAADLSLLLGAATASSSWLAISTGNFNRNADELAEALLKGEKITAYDIQADGVLYGHLKEKHLATSGSGTGVYLVDLDNIIRGLEAAANGTYTGALERGKDPGASAFTSLYFRDISAFSGDEAEVLLQIILFNEIVY